MGCASSSPLITASNGGVMEVAKGAATDAVHAGEEVLNDVKDTFNHTVDNVKEAVVGAVHNVGTSLDNVLSGEKDETSANIVMEHAISSKEKTMNDSEPDFKYIPLKDPNMNQEIKEKLEDLEETVVENITDETEKLTEDFIKETEDIIDLKKIDNVDNSKTTKTINKSNSRDSLKTDSPDSEIENAMANTDDSNDPPTPKPTFLELEQLQKASSAVIESAAKNYTSQMASLEYKNE